MTEASFPAAGYAFFIEDDSNQKLTSLCKLHAPVAYGSKSFTPAQIRMSRYAKEVLAISFAFEKFGLHFWGAPELVIILTDNKAMTQFFQTKLVRPALWSACDYVIQFNFVLTHIPGAQITAAEISLENPWSRADFAKRNQCPVSSTVPRRTNLLYNRWRENWRT